MKVKLTPLTPEKTTLKSPALLELSFDVSLLNRNSVCADWIN